MKKVIAVCLTLVLVLSLVGCNRKTQESMTPTGYPSGEVQFITVFYNSNLYRYSAEGFDLPLEDGYEKAGEILEVNNLEYPNTEFHGTRLNIGQEIYANSNDVSKIYVKYESGYALFRLENTTE